MKQDQDVLVVNIQDLETGETFTYRVEIPKKLSEDLLRLIAFGVSVKEHRQPDVLCTWALEDDSEE